jgi:hypothetical protein
VSCVAFVPQHEIHAEQPYAYASEAMPPRTDFDFTRFCQATHAWLADSASLDPALAAAADLLQRGLDDRGLAALATNAADTHTLLGAQVLLDLVRWCDLEDV